VSHHTLASEESLKQLLEIIYDIQENIKSNAVNSHECHYLAQEIKNDPEI
jgi:hypothetical protein